MLNSAPHRGRIYDAVDKFPKVMTDLSQRNLCLAVNADQTLQMIPPTHLLLLYYKTLQEANSAYIPWHQDNGENDGENTFPVISFNIGDSCDFLICHRKPNVSQGYSIDNPMNLAHRVLFESGDVLIFGGPCRFIWHSIYKIHAYTAPHFLSFIEGRLNFTFRHAPSVIGDEKRFSTIDAKNLSKDNQFFKLSKMK